MLHTDFVSNFCLFFEHAYRLDTRRQKKRARLRCCQRVGAGIRASPLFVPNRTRRRARATPVSGSGLSAIRFRGVYQRLLFSARAVFSDG